ncbi:MAG: ATP-dependent Clp protease adaptor ClpS [Phycisphaerales bacterium]|nr:ATP-dependent Clp protease adaptor ClpS [Phycisphaerales bacterium]MCB9840927.1 ATP-dependent Clp protease adaptor ClpS [Phycisphaeraceae bacterium]
MGQGHPEGDRGTERAANGGGAAVAERAPAKSPPRLDKLPPYRVLLHNDDKNDMLFVVGTLREIAALDRDDAVRVMVEAHKRGVSLVKTTHKERAELYVDQFRSKGLTATCEPAE